MQMTPAPADNLKDSVPDNDQPEAPETSLAKPTSERQIAANRANARKSTGPRTAEGKERVGLNFLSRSVRLLGIAEARTLNQEPDVAGKLYRDLIAPYEPAPALLALHFQDLARLELELQTWERIRDAQLEDRAQQNRLEVRRRYREMDLELRATAAEVVESGVYRMPDSPGKFKKQIECLKVLKAQLTRRDFDALLTPLHQLYGKKLDPDYERAQLICVDCQSLMEKDELPLPENELAALLRLVEEELKDASEAYELQLDQRTMTGAACLARLAPRRKEHSFILHGEYLRRAIDRNKRLTPGLLKMLGLAQQCEPTDEEKTKKSAIFTQPKPRHSYKSLKTNDMVE